MDTMPEVPQTPITVPCEELDEEELAALGDETWDAWARGEINEEEGWSIINGVLSPQR